MRIGRIIVGAGCLLIIAGAAMLWLGERKLANIASVEKSTIELNDLSTVDPAMHGKVVHAIGKTHTDEILTDPEFGVEEHAVGLQRDVFYYQLVENIGRKSKWPTHIGIYHNEPIMTFQYGYGSEWSTTPISSYNYTIDIYKSSNFVLKYIKPRAVDAKAVSLGAYWLCAEQISAITARKPANVSLSPQIRKQWAAEIAMVCKERNIPNTNPNSFIYTKENAVYIGRDTAHTSIGDVSVIIMKKPTDAKVSIVAEVDSATFRPIAVNDSTLLLTCDGAYSKAEMFKKVKQATRDENLPLQIIGIGLIPLGLLLIFMLIESNNMQTPLLCDLLYYGRTMAIIATSVAICGVTVASAWLTCIPMITLGCIAAIIIFMWLMWRNAAKKLYRGEGIA